MNSLNTLTSFYASDGGVGKTTFINSHLTGEFVPKYIPTLGVEVRPLKFNTTKGPIHFNVWDFAGQEKFGRNRGEYYIHTDCAIIMFDLQSWISYKNHAGWIEELESISGKHPYVTCGAKSDIGEPTYNISHLYIRISSKSNYNYQLPFLILARQLLKDENLQFIADEAGEPCECDCCEH